MKKIIIQLFTGVFVSAILWVQGFAQPEARETAILCYYPSMHGMLLFDGYAIHPPNGKNSVWKWDGKQWTEINVSGPVTKTLSSGAYDTKNNVAIIFGGVGKEGYQELTGDSWLFDGRQWKKLSTNDIDTRDHHKMVYADHLDAFVLYGGINSKRNNDSATWLLREGRWTSLDIPGPGPRFHFGMAYDPLRKKIVLYGGYNGRGLQHDTWEFDGNIWQQINVEGAGPRGRLAMAYDPDRKMIILHGGDVWKKKVDTSINKDGEIWDVRGDTWGWNGKQWIKIADDGPARTMFAIGYDSGRHVLVGFGGADDFVYSDTWELKDNYWEKVADNGTWRWEEQGYKKVR